MPDRADMSDTIESVNETQRCREAARVDVDVDRLNMFFLESGRCPLTYEPRLDTWRSPRAFEPQSRTIRTPRRSQIEREILEGFERNEFELFYQPVAHSLDDRLGGFEALMRWHHPTRGCLTPDSFLDIAVDLGLASDLGEWTLTQAAHAVAQLEAVGERSFIAVNLFSAQLDDGKLLQSMQRAADAASVPITALAVELSEETVTRDVPIRRATVEALRSVGVTVAIDDFGVGYSNLMRLRELDVDYLKIDRSIISNVDTDPVSRRFLEIVMALASALGVEAIAEGIETAAQAAILAEVGCVWMQGFHIGRPLPLEHVVAATCMQLVS